jgi:histidinol dehydrogenase
MPITLDTSASDFAARFETFLGSKREASEDVDASAREILRGVESRGDDALIEYSKKFDRVTLTPETIRISAAEIDAAFKSADKKTLDALQFAKDRIEAHHKKQVPQDQRYVDPLGVELGYRWSALESVGIYVPGERAADCDVRAGTRWRD